MSKIADKVTELAEPIVKDFGCTLYKVKYLKEGPDYYLRVFIEKESGVGINDCENISKALEIPGFRNTVESLVMTSTSPISASAPGS